MSVATRQDAQIFKERCEDSPGILLLCQGDWQPTPDRVRLFEEQNYFVVTAANGYRDNVDWLPQPRCIGALLAHPENVETARQQYPEKIIERFEGVGARFLRTLTQELPFGLHNAGAPFTATAPSALKTVDVVSVFSPVPLKRGQLLVDALVAADVTAYLFAQSLGADTALLQSFFDVLRAAGKSVEYLHYPFDPYALMIIDGRIVVDGRPIGANNSVVSAYLARARLFVHTSTTEGISNSIMEALLSDVPVLLCDDIRGPQQALSRQMPQCIHRCEPDASALGARIRSLLAAPRSDGSVRAGFLRTIDPFEINRRVVRGAQNWFASRGLPWKGHCLGLFGGVQSNIDIAEVSPEASYRGGRHIYPSVAGAAQCADFQRTVAARTGHPDYVDTLSAELRCFAELAAASAAGSAGAEGAATPAADANPTEFDRLVDALASDADLKHVVLIGAGTWRRRDRLIALLGANPHRPHLHCIETSPDSFARLQAACADQRHVSCYRASPLGIDAFATETEVAECYAKDPGKLRDYPLQTVLQWRRLDIAAMQSAGLDTDGLRTISESHAIERFDMAIVDGREFTALAELQRLVGADIVVLGCTRTFKNRAGMRALSNDPAYELLCSAPDLGNGFAAYARRDFIRRGGLGAAVSRLTTTPRSPQQSATLDSLAALIDG